MSDKPSYAVVAVAVLVLAAAFLRLIPHPPNFAPIVAMALFAGAYVPDRRWAIMLPLLAMVLSDMVLGFHTQMWMVYVSLVAVAAVGFLLRGRVRLTTVAFGTVGGSITFFVLSNLAVWAGSGLYPVTGTGLVACFVAAIPFFQNALAGDLFYAAVLFGGYAALTRVAPATRAQAA